MNATAIPNSIVVSVSGSFPEYSNGYSVQFYIETACVDYDAYKVLPPVVGFEGRVYGKTGWNSDLGTAYYQTGAKVAHGV